MNQVFDEIWNELIRHLGALTSSADRSASPSPAEPAAGPKQRSPIASGGLADLPVAHVTSPWPPTVPPWDWTALQIIRLLRAYPSGITHSMLLTELTMRWQTAQDAGGDTIGSGSACHVAAAAAAVAANTMCHAKDPAAMLPPSLSSRSPPSSPLDQALRRGRTTVAGPVELVVESIAWTPQRATALLDVTEYRSLAHGAVRRPNRPAVTLYLHPSLQAWAALRYREPERSSFHADSATESPALMLPGASLRIAHIQLKRSVMDRAAPRLAVAWARAVTVPDEGVLPAESRVPREPGADLTRSAMLGGFPTTSHQRTAVHVAHHILPTPYVLPVFAVPSAPPLPTFLAGFCRMTATTKAAQGAEMPCTVRPDVWLGRVHHLARHPIPSTAHPCSSSTVQFRMVLRSATTAASAPPTLLAPHRVHLLLTAAQRSILALRRDDELLLIVDPVVTEPPLPHSQKCGGSGGGDGGGDCGPNVSFMASSDVCWRVGPATLLAAVQVSLPAEKNIPAAPLSHAPSIHRPIAAPSGSATTNPSRYRVLGSSHAVSDRLRTGHITGSASLLSVLGQILAMTPYTGEWIFIHHMTAVPAPMNAAGVGDGASIGMYEKMARDDDADIDRDHLDIDAVLRQLRSVTVPLVRLLNSPRKYAVHCIAAERWGTTVLPVYTSPGWLASSFASRPLALSHLAQLVAHRRTISESLEGAWHVRASLVGYHSTRSPTQWLPMDALLRSMIDSPGSGYVDYIMSTNDGH
ncbi:hypothetical protein CXG81DRAFT_20458 [Caulochytrium protostelioides]|uniref:Cell division control protein 24 OB domain-containing protein n=1 Tax=Caulochytrium protostelioides TaxID=1555241 RepID=A0A4P9X376_9FUNG|nr:hypothetical protein CXG81DRAFT_20458 [Caulochytrium protostelioides]|eukprot:RKO99466.1 hypothetical protein CXG81DRAFT_20458 [Caulochytrium protostelioides]